MTDDLAEQLWNCAKPHGDDDDGELTEVEGIKYACRPIDRDINGPWLYRGTSTERAADEEFGQDAVQGVNYRIYEGFMNPDDIDWDANYRGESVDDLPWEKGYEPRVRSKGVTGGFTQRLGAAFSFSGGGGIPLVLFMRERNLGNATPIQYDYDWFNGLQGSLSWVDGVAGGEIYVNEELLGKVVKKDGEWVVRAWGDDLKRDAMSYSDEMEWIVPGRSEVPLSSNVDLVVTYTRRPKSMLSSLDGYTTRHVTPDDDEKTIIGDWDHGKVLRTLWSEGRSRVPMKYPYALAHIESIPVMDTWELPEELVNHVFDGHNLYHTEEVPDYIRGA